MGHKQTLILLEIHVEIVENNTVKANDKFWPFLEKCQQVGIQIAVYIVVPNCTVCPRMKLSTF